MGCFDAVQVGLREQSDDEGSSTDFRYDVIGCVFILDNGLADTTTC